jgi:N-acetylmuramoyl-L-alanine amidase
MVLILSCLLPLSAGWAASTLKYDTLRIGQENGVVRVVLDLNGPSTMKYFSLPTPDRFVVDLSDIVRVGNKPAVDLANTPISVIRTGIRDGGDLRLVLELSAAAKGKAYLLPPAEGHGHRLVIELMGGAVAKRAEPAPVVKAEEPVKRAEPAPVVKAADPVKRVESATVAPVTAPVVTATPAPVAALAAAAQKIEAAAPPQVKKEAVAIEQARDIVIAIDAGHGGADVGAIGAKGTYEKEVVLQIARRLEERVREEPGMVPLMTRDGDHFVTLRDRINKARSNKADMFISIHADAFPNQNAKGASVYALSQRGATNEAARMLANRENAADLVGGVSLDDKDQLLASVLLDLSQSATIEASLDVAGRVLQGLRRVGKVHKNHVEQAGFVVLKSPDIPSILVETAFISNPTEEANLQSAAYQQNLADAIMKGVRSYFASNPPQGTRIAAREHVIKRGETLTGIATQYKVSPRILRVANRLKDDSVRIGQVLQIPLSDS